MRPSFSAGSWSCRSDGPPVLKAWKKYVLSCENLEVAAQLEARPEHVQVVVVVFDVEHFGHVSDSVLLTAALITSSLDHLVGAQQYRRWNCDADRFGGLEIYDKLKFGLLFDPQIAKLGASEYFIDVH